MASSITTAAVAAARQESLSDYDDSPSPSQISPGLTQSTSNSASNTSSSPPELVTPPRPNRHRKRYPELGHVPLHRRGTSQHYERLEDLLKEAGYKETRIFTPETDRVQRSAERDSGGESDNRLSVVKDSVGAVVEFLSGFIPGHKRAESTTPVMDQLTASPQEYSPPLSPLAYRHHQFSSTTLGTESSVPPSAMTSSFGSLGEPLSASQEFGHPDIVVNGSTPQQRRTAQSRMSTSQASLASSRLQNPPSRGSLASSSNHVVSPRPSPATAYLRHMASHSSIPQRPSSTPVSNHNRSQLSLNESDYPIRSPHPHTPSDGIPPLPSSWLETVARAVMYGGAGSHIGGPSSSSTDGSFTPTTASSTKTTQTLRPTRSSISQASQYRKQPPPMTRNGLSDQTNTRMRNAYLHVPPPPALFRGRSGHLDSELSLTRVMCRSAPGSRASSLVRGASTDGTEKRRRERERGRNERRKDGRANDMLRVPSLARTQVEGDVWSSAEGTKRRRGSRSYIESEFGDGEGEGVASGRKIGTKLREARGQIHISGSGSEGDNDGEDDDDVDEEDEDESEITLAQMLLPPKRQNSIKSLRKHLDSHSRGHGRGLGLGHGQRDRGDAQADLKHVVGAGAASGFVERRRGQSVGGRATSLVAPRRTGSGLDEADSDDELGSEHLARWRARQAFGTRKRNRGSDDEDADSFAGFYNVGGEPMGSGRSRTGKSRLGINSAWGLIGGGS